MNISKEHCNLLRLFYICLYARQEKEEQLGYY